MRLCAPGRFPPCQGPNLYSRGFQGNPLALCGQQLKHGFVLRNKGGRVCQPPICRRCAALPVAFANTLTPAETWALVAACAAVGQVVQERTPVGNLLSGPMLALGMGLALAATGILPQSSGVYGVVFDSVLPFASALLLLESDLRQLGRAGADTLVAFALACIGTLLGTMAAWLLIGARLGHDGWKVAGALCGTYIGGSVNFAAVSQTLGIADMALLPAVMSADNIATAFFLAIISILPANDKPSPVSSFPPVEHLQENRKVATPESLAVSLGAAACICAVAPKVAAGIGMSKATFAVIALLASMLGAAGAALAPAARPFAGAEALGGALMLMFFVVIGAAAGSLSALATTGWLAAFILVQLAVHILVVLSGGSALRLPMQAVLTASNAAVGGPGTAAAMATGRGWTHMVQPAMLTGALGYTIGTALGCAVGQALRALPAGSIL